MNRPLEMEKDLHLVSFFSKYFIVIEVFKRRVPYKSPLAEGQPSLVELK